MLNDSVNFFFLICLKCNTLSTQTSFYKCFFFRVCPEMLITAEALVTILDTNAYFSKRYYFLCLGRVYASFLEYCAENLILFCVICGKALKLLQSTFMWVIFSVNPLKLISYPFPLLIPMMPLMHITNCFASSIRHFNWGINLASILLLLIVLNPCCFIVDVLGVG